MNELQKNLDDVLAAELTLPACHIRSRVGIGSFKNSRTWYTK